ncbi:MAG TPA: relaxase/mobilization nuclease domain-containing protein [Niabella sp.]|nr:relaxase/mobilization nuclease domain-containing protein [Niabella sp.]
MRPQITFPTSLSRALNYHEKKVEKGTAELLHAHNFYKLAEELKFRDKKERFQDLMDLNERAKTKLIHISLNFHPSEKERLSKEFYMDVADKYMDKIGFGDQPYLVYQHEDAGHPHVHVLAPLIKEDGSRIATHNIAKNLSEPARKEIEKEFGLIPADKKDKQQQRMQPELAISPQKVQAGKSEVQRSITNVLDHVIEKYRYTSLNELNAVLKLYNVKADSGVEGGRIHRHKGLTYVVIDKDGKALTKPIKASAFYNKPTLAFIEKKCEQNKPLREAYKQKLKTAIEWSFRSKPGSLNELAKGLKKEQVDLVIRRSVEGKVYGLTYIDHNNRTVFNGSDLGKEYAAKKILERLDLESQQEKQIFQKLDKEFEKHHTQEKSKEKAPEKESARAAGKIIEQIVDPNGGNESINKELLNEKNRKRKKGLDWGMDF